jgi:hypothetical protein
MPVIESPQIAELNNLNATLSRLTADVKAKQSVLKELNEQVLLTETACQKKIAAAQERTETSIMEIEQQLIPLAGKRHLVEEADQLLLMRRASLEQETARLKHERHIVLSALTEQVTVQSTRLRQIETAIAHCKATVAGV